ncbi:MAG: hypothetical protein ACN6I2_00285 [Candidatus Hopanoidivoransaceae bacterium]
MITTQRSSHGFVHEVEIGASVAAVREVLADLDAQAEFHPLIESIEEIAPAPNGPTPATIGSPTGSCSARSGSGSPTTLRWRR